MGIYVFYSLSSSPLDWDLLDYDCYFITRTHLREDIIVIIE